MMTSFWRANNIIMNSTFLAWHIYLAAYVNSLLVLFNGFSRTVGLLFGTDSGSIQCVNVEAIDDQLLENIEVHTAVIVTNDTSILPLFPASFVIMDNNSKLFIFKSMAMAANLIIIIYIAVTLMFEQSQYQVFEDETTVEICVNVLGDSSIDIAAIIQLIPDGTAQIDTDFQFSPVTLLFMASSSIPRSCHSIAVFMDEIIENDEIIVLSLSTIFARVVAAVPVTEVVIRDSTTGRIDYVSGTEIAITEGESIPLCFGTVLQLERDVDVRIQFNDITEGIVS